MPVRSFRHGIGDSRMWVESVGEFEQNFQSVESFALAENSG
jgi:hypothetical protein